MQLAENRVLCLFLSPWQECLGPMTDDPMHNNGRQCAPLLFAARLGIIDNLSPTQLFFIGCHSYGLQL